MRCKTTGWLGLIILLLPAIVGAQEPTRLTTLDWDGECLVLGFDGPFDGKPWRMSEPDRLIIDFRGVRSTLVKNRYDGAGAVEGVRIGQTEEGQSGGMRCRVVLDLSAASEYSYELVDGTMRLTLDGSGAAPESSAGDHAAAAPAPGSPLADDPAADADPPSSTPEPTALASRQGTGPAVELADSAAPLPEPFALAGRQFTAFVPAKLLREAAAATPVVTATPAAMATPAVVATPVAAETSAAMVTPVAKAIAVELPATGFASKPEQKKGKGIQPVQISEAGLAGGGTWIVHASAPELEGGGREEESYSSDPFVAEEAAQTGAAAPAPEQKPAAIAVAMSEQVPQAAPQSLPINLANWREAAATTVPSGMENLLSGEQANADSPAAKADRQVGVLESAGPAQQRAAKSEKPVQARRAQSSGASAEPMQFAQASDPPQSKSERGSMNPPKEAAQDPDAVLLRSSRVKQDSAPISLDMRGADFRTVMRAFSEFSGQNIIGSHDVKGKVSVQLSEMPWREALSAVCDANGFGIVEERGMLRVALKKMIVQEEMESLTAQKKRMEYRPLTTEVTNLYYAQASELTAPLGKMLSERGKIDVDERTNSLLITDLPEIVDQVLQLAHVLDRPMPQVEIIARIVDLDYRASRDLGIRWEAINLSSSKAGLAGGAVIDATLPDAVAEVKIGTVRTLGELNVTLQAMEKDNKANIISNPRVMTMDNREASILVGKKIPLIVADEAGNAVTQLTTIGIKLRVTPHINPDGQIMMDLHTEVSDLASEATVQGGVIITTSESHTKVMVNGGETAVIAGLIKTGDSELHNRVPFLGRIPILGRLFGYENETDSKRELIIFVTPRILEASASSTSTSDFRIDTPEG